jgi:hypothetical protein
VEINRFLEREPERALRYVNHVIPAVTGTVTVQVIVKGLQ